MNVNMFVIKLYVLLVASMVETALHLECVRVPLDGLVVTVDKVATYVLAMCILNVHMYDRYVRTRV